MDANATVGVFSIDSASTYTIGGSSTLTLAGAAGGSAYVSVTQGTHTVSAPVYLGTPMSATVTGTSTKLTLSSPVTAATGAGLAKFGTGTLEVGGVRADSLAVHEGKVVVTANGSSAAASRLNTLTIASGATLDLNDNALVVDYAGTSPLRTIRDLLAIGYDGGAWDGTGITSSTAVTDGMTIGYIEASFKGWTAVDGISLDSTAVVLRYWIAGDANMDGIVNQTDQNAVTGHWQQTDQVWTTGDFNYDGIVNQLDLNIVTANWQATMPFGTSPLPEPSLLAASPLLVLYSRRLRR
jgi:hypothetical protein